jgi:RNA-directed DNA polymerase
MKVHNDIFKRIISLENLFSAWDEFRKDKQKKRDVLWFEWRLEENIFRLHRELNNKQYCHGPYTSFYITDPKVRHIHKAAVRDRILHHAVFSMLNPIFEPSFIAYSFSCQEDKGTHKGVSALERMLWQVSNNHTASCYALKCDIKQFFGSVDHDILFAILKRRIQDDDALWLIKEIIAGFTSDHTTIFERKGLPIGNLTSQLFANIYLNEFDQYVKHILKVKKYVRYTDDFVIVSENRAYLENIITLLRKFLTDRLLLTLHPRKVTIRKFSRGINFLGYILLPHYRLLRTKTERRIFRKLHRRAVEYHNGIIQQESLEQSLQSYLGVLSHANAYKISQELLNHYWYWQSE